MSRLAFPSRRAAETFEVFHAGQKYFVSIGRYPGRHDPEGPIGEVFVQAKRTSSEIEAVGRDTAIMISRQMQAGASVNDIRHSLTRDESGQAASLVGTILDTIATMWPEEASRGLKMVGARE